MRAPCLEHRLSVIVQRYHDRVALVLSLLLACHLAGCVDAPIDEPELGPRARIITVWDPLACGEPHRVVVELEDPDGRRVSRSAPCELGRVTIDVVRWGVYRGRIYAWTSGPEISAVVPIYLVVDAAYVYWFIDTPR